VVTGSRRIRASLCAPALVLALAGAASASPYAVEVTADVLNVRSSPGGTVVGAVHQGTRLVTDASQGAWLHVDVGGMSAYVHSAYVRRVSAEVVAATTDVNVRTGADASYSRIGLATSGQRYVRLGQDSGWSLIQFDDRTGWVVSWAVGGGSTTSTSSSSSSSSSASTPSSSSSSANRHPPMAVSQAELEVLARIVKGEAAQCPTAGKVAVAAVVLNRVRSSRFPSTITAVAHQPYQFSCYNANLRASLYYGAIPQSCWDAARAAVAGSDPSLGATYYFNPYLVRPSWAASLRFTVRIGTSSYDTHDFYKP
jgi:uncharacterized protein YraI